MDIIIILNQFIVLSILIVTGVIGARTGVITQFVKDAISKLVFNITLPLLIITTFSNMPVNKEMITNGLWVFAFSNFGILMFLGLGYYTSRILRLNKNNSGIHTIHTSFGNIVFLGFPVINSLFPGGEGLFYAALFHLTTTYFVWTLGVYLLAAKHVNLKQNLKNLLNPNTVAFMIGITMMITGLKIPEVAYNALSGMGNTTIYLSMLYIGSMLAYTNIQGVFKRKDIIFLSLNKLIVGPVLLLIIVNLIIGFTAIELSNMAKTVLVLQSAMPSMSIIVIMAKNYGANDQNATENVFLTTILSIITLPFLYYLIIYF